MSNGLSYLCRPMGKPYRYQSIPDRLIELAAEDPTRDAFIFYDKQCQRHAISRKQLLDDAVTFAKCLVSLGVRQGTTVSFCMSNSMAMLTGIYGALTAGAITVFSNVNMKDGSDLIEMMCTLNVEVLIIDTNGQDENWHMLECIWPMKESLCTKVPTLKAIICNGTTEGLDLRHRVTLEELRQQQCPVTLPHVQPEDYMTFFGTSGSTGKPKIVKLTHFGILNWTRVCDETFPLTNKSVFFCDRTFGWVVGFPRSYPAEGATRVFIDTHMSVAGGNVECLCEIIKNEHCDTIILPGYLVTDILKRPTFTSYFSAVNTIILAGERVPKRSVAGLHGSHSRRVVSFYGTTEIGGASCFVNDDVDQYEDGIIGTPVKGVEIKLVSEDGKVVPRGEHGLMCVRSLMRFAAYLPMSPDTPPGVDEGGWFHTGDMAYVRSDGNIVVLGREVEMISVGTFKYFPGKIEKAVAGLPGAKQVFAVGVPDERLMQVVCICVKPNPGIELKEEDVRAYCNTIFLEEDVSTGVGIKPHYYIILDDIPMLPSGKIDRRGIAKLAKEAIGL